MHSSPIHLWTPLHIVVLEHLERALRHAASALRTLVAHLQRERRCRITRLALSGLDDRTLHDLGLHRSEILSVANGEHAHERRIRRA